MQYGRFYIENLKMTLYHSIQMERDVRVQFKAKLRDFLYFMDHELKQASINFELFSKGKSSAKLESHKETINQLNESFKEIF